MKRTAKPSTEMKPEYRFDYAKAQPNRFARQWGRRTGLLVLIDPDMAHIFKTPEAVNRALHAISEAIPSLGRRAA